MNKPFSIYLDLVRFAAAAVVFCVHANYHRFTGGLPLFWRLNALGNDAVMVFFVLSGFVIAYVADVKEKTLPDYALSRLARLYSVAAPALVLTLFLDLLGSRIDPELYAGSWFQFDQPAWRFFANFFYVNELWFMSVRAFSNGPFWSLGYEFWYYVLFAIAWYVRPPRRYLLLAAACLLIGPKILMLLPVWLLGVWVYFQSRSRPLSKSVGWMLFVGSAAAYAAFRLAGFPDRLLDWTYARLGHAFVRDELMWSKYFLSSYVLGPLVALHLWGALSVAPRLARPLSIIEKPVRSLAACTFAIYLFHYPLLQFFAAATRGVEPIAMRRGIVLSGTVAAIWALGAVTEKRKSALKRGLQSLYARFFQGASRFEA